MPGSRQVPLDGRARPRPKADARSGQRRDVPLTSSLVRREQSAKSFFHVVTTDEARSAIAALSPVATEIIGIAAGLGRVLAHNLSAPADLPQFHRANMDGYAVRAQDTFGASGSVPAYLRVVGSVEMGKAPTRTVRKGEAMRIATGGMLPAGADAVVMIEYTDEPGDGTVEVHRGAAPWEHVLRVGEDITKGEAVFTRGRRLRARDLGALTGLGITRVPVFRQPRAALLSTGDEIVPPTVKPRPGQVRNINSYALLGMAAEAGAAVDDLGVIPDEPDLLRRALARGLEKHDVVFISGGSSVGAKDMTLEIITSFPRSEIIFHGISVAPGKPTILARALGKPVVGLPGHPVSALVIFEVFGAPLLRVLGGENPEVVFRPLRTLRARLSQNVASQPGREDYVRVTLTASDGKWLATPMAGKSGAIFNLVRADGLVCIPASAEGLEAGVEVEILLL